MIWMLNAFELAKKEAIYPAREPKVMTNFIR